MREGLRETPRISIPTKKSQKENEDASNKNTDAFSEQSLQNAWKRFKEENQEMGSPEKIILSRELKKVKESGVIIELISPLELPFFEKIEQNLATFLRSNLNNEALTLSHRIIKKQTLNEKKEGRKLYTDNEKLNYMISQNEAISELKNRLGLDFDY